jgi:hypothetical protein
MEKIVLAANNLRAALALEGKTQGDIDTLIANLQLEINCCVPPYLQGEPGPLKAAINNTELLTAPQKTQFITDIE